MNLKEIPKKQNQNEIIQNQEDQILQLNQENLLLQEELSKTKRKNQNLQEYNELLENEKNYLKFGLLKTEDTFEKTFKKLNILKIIFSILPLIIVICEFL